MNSFHHYTVLGRQSIVSWCNFLGLLTGISYFKETVMGTCPDLPSAMTSPFLSGVLEMIGFPLTVVLLMASGLCEMVQDFSVLLIIN